MKWIPCDLCGGRLFKTLYSTKDRRFPIQGAFQLVRCLDCGLIYLNPQPEPHELKSHYLEERYDAYQRGGGAVNIVDSERLDRWREIRRRIVRRAQRYFPSLREEVDKEMASLGPFSSGLRVLDVGCGVGNTLTAYREKGAMTFGVDISPQACETGRGEGHEMFCGQLSDAEFEAGFFDVVRFHHSLEHMASPSDNLLEARRILRPGGRIFISVPNHGSLQGRVFGEWFYAIESPRHLFGFTARTLVRLLTQSGFVLDALHTSSFPGGPCFSLENWLNDRFRRKGYFYYGQMKVKRWYILAELLLFLPRIPVNLLRLGESLTVCARRP